MCKEVARADFQGEEEIFILFFLYLLASSNLSYILPISETRQEDPDEHHQYNGSV